jgi:hypothetical protein
MSAPRSCPTPQKPLLSEAAAERRAEVIAEKWGVEMEPYLCPCGVWHLRSVAKRRRKLNRKRREQRRRVRARQEISS